MRKKEQITSVKWSSKNKVYLQRLGMIDARTGKVIRNKNISGFINDCVTIICQSEMYDKCKMASSNELREAWIKFSLIKRQKQVNELQEEMVRLNNMRTQEQQIKKVLVENNLGGK